MELYINYQEEEHRDPTRDTGAYQLWVAVIFDAVKAFTKSRGRNQLAKSFLFEKNNPFVEAVCGQLEIDPEAMRERVMEKVTSWS